jgi:toxin ParE1/3/4
MRYLVIGSYLVLYKVDEDAVRIVRILHAHRDLGGLFVE